MPVKLQVVKEGADADDPADYLFEQDRITIGRGQNNDLTLPDQKVSAEHAEIRIDGGTYLLLDRDSKNNTYVDGRQVGEDEPYVLRSGDVFRVGDFRVEFAPLFMPSSEQTAYAEEGDDANPFAQHARQLGAALDGLAETYRVAPADERDEAVAAALQEHVDLDGESSTAVRHFLELIADDGDDPADGPADAAAPDAPDDARDTVLDALLRAVARMIRIPDHFWREFAGNTLVHPSDTEFLHTADLDTLRGHLLGPSVDEATRETRLEHLEDAVDGVVSHNMALLASYQKAVAAGGQKLLERVDPEAAVVEAEQDTRNGFFGSGARTTDELDRLHDAWTTLHQGDWGDIERELFRPTYVEAYVDRMAETWDVEAAEVLREAPSSEAE